MQRLHSNPAPFWAPEKVGVRLPLLIFSSCLALGTPENARVTLQSCPLLGPKAGRGEIGTSDFLPVLGVGDPQECMGYIAIPPPFGPPGRQG